MSGSGPVRSLKSPSPAALFGVPPIVEPSPPPAPSAGHGSPSAWAAGALVLVLLAFLPTLRSFHEVWTDWYTHGYPIAGLCLYVLWRDGRDLKAPARGWSWALPGVVGLSLLWLAAWILSVQVVHEAVIPLLLLVGSAVVFAAAGVRVVLPVALTFLLAVPLWEVLTRPLQSLTVAVNESILGLFGMEATIRAFTITIPYGTFLVAESCAGLGYLVIALVVGAFYALLFLRRWPARVAVVGVAAALAILANQVRVFGLIWIGYRSRMESPLMETHGTYGWIVFGLFLVPLFFVARWIDERERRALASGAGSGPSLAPASPPDPGSGDVGTAGFRVRLGLTAGLAVVGPIALLALGLLPTDQTVEPGPPGLAAAAEWSHVEGAEPAVAYDWRPAYHGMDEVRTSTWWRGGDTVRVDRLIYLEQHQGKELIGGDNRIAPGPDLLGARTLGPVGPEGRRLQEAVVDAGGERVLVWYWYRVAGTTTHSASRAKLLGLEGVLRRRPVAELVAASAPCRTGDCADAVPVLADLVLGIDARVAGRPAG